MLKRVILGNIVSRKIQPEIRCLQPFRVRENNFLKPVLVLELSIGFDSGI